jgi:hypothetical protein
MTATVASPPFDTKHDESAVVPATTRWTTTDDHV